jgi:hypothetical protein
MLVVLVIGGYEQRSETEQSPSRPLVLTQR